MKNKSLKDLLAKRAELDLEIKKAQVRERVDLLARMEALAAESGLTVNDVLGVKQKRTPAVKFRNPKNPAQTWTGRGRRPSWLESKDPSIYAVS